MKKFFLLIVGLFQVAILFATNAKYKCDDYYLNITYNEVITPGDAIFARLAITTPKNHKMAKADERKATLQLLKDKKVVDII